MTEPLDAQHRIQEIKVKGSQLIEKVRELVEEGNVRRVVIKKENRVLLEFPLSIGVGGATAALILAPTLAAVGAVAALVSDVNVLIERPAESPDLIIPPTATPPQEQ